MKHHLSRRRFAGGSVAALSSLSLSAPTLPTASARTTSLAWELIETEGASPGPRWDHTLAVADDARSLLLFGGRDASSAAFADTWVFERGTGTWVDKSGSGPTARFGHAVATDQAAGVTYLFGGQENDTFFNDLWAFDYASGAWSLVDDGTGAAPSPRYGTSMVISSDGALIVSHGFTVDGRFNDTWAFDLTSPGWTDISPAAETDRPLNRCLHEAVWDERSAVMLLYGGCSSGYGPCPQADLWAFDPAAGTWNLVEAGDTPPGRTNPALAYDRGRKQTILFGGLTEAGNDAGCWSLSIADESSWTSISTAGTSPEPRSSHDICITGPKLYLFGGMTEAGPAGDFWLARLDR